MCSKPFSSGCANVTTNEIAAANNLKTDGKVLPKLYDKLVRKPEPGASTDQQTQSVAEAIRAMKMNPEVTRRTLGEPFDYVDLPLYLAATKKLIAINRGEAEPDDRDSPAYQTPCKLEILDQAAKVTKQWEGENVFLTSVPCRPSKDAEWV